METIRVVGNENKVKVGVKLYYIDSTNFQKWFVTSIDEYGFEAIDSDGHEDYFVFNELQFGWQF